MDYAVNYPELSAHASKVEALHSDAQAALRDAEIGAAGHLLPGGTAAPAARNAAARFQIEVDALLRGLDAYHETSVHNLVSYQQQEAEAVAAVESFLGGL